MKSTLNYILYNLSKNDSLITYREFTAEHKSYDKSIHCDYCGIQLSTQGDYCSDLCKQKDSVWHKEDEI